MWSGEEVMFMKGNEKEEDFKRMKKDKKTEDEKKLPYCTTAPSAEHTRSSDKDGPCDDGRSGDVEE
jgi:hypothetical protein